jgi:hypothetical protein
MPYGFVSEHLFFWKLQKIKPCFGPFQPWQNCRHSMFVSDLSQRVCKLYNVNKFKGTASWDFGGLLRFCRFIVYPLVQSSGWDEPMAHGMPGALPDMREPADFGWFYYDPASNLLAYHTVMAGICQWSPPTLARSSNTRQWIKCRCRIEAKSAGSGEPDFTFTHLLYGP